MININDIECVYSGKSDTCYCGCAGKYFYNPDYVKQASKSRGYEVTSDEVDFKTVRRIVNKLNRNFSNVEVMDNATKNAKIYILRVGNHDYTAYAIDRTEEKLQAAAKEKNRKEATQLLVDTFNKKHEASIVYLRVDNESDYGTFQIHFKMRDNFVDGDIYDRGNAIIYTSDALYEEIQKLAGDIKVNWNNTRSIGWLSV